MAQIFISHSSEDSAQAERLLEWLHGQGFVSAFLDVDTEGGGMTPGIEWEKKLYRELSACDAVILILTKNWFDSKWCFVEYAQARALGKAIFPLQEEPAAAKLVSPEIHHLSLIKNRETALKQLRVELMRIAVDKRSGFAWDSQRPVFPGLLAFREADAAIYFGRDDSIQQLMERLNARSAQGGEKLVVVLGASGSGKSSLLRAGIVPRLKRDVDRWIVLPVVRPQLHPLNELAQAIAAGLGDAARWREWSAALEEPDLTTTLADLARDLRAAHKRTEAHILLVIDQGEELFGAAEPRQSGAFFVALNAMLDERLPFLATMALRSDYLGRLQSVSALTAPFDQFSLKPMPLERVAEIIKGPANVAGITVDDALVAAAIADAKTADTLPLLAFALRELYDKTGNGGHFSEQAYRALGDGTLTPLENAVRQKADEVVRKANPSQEEFEALKNAFIPFMVRVNSEGEFARKTAEVSKLPPPALRLIKNLADSRLLTIAKNGPEATVEVTHEALLRNWPRLRSWLDEEREFLIGKGQLEQDLRDWENAAPEQREDALLSGLKLTRARTWLAANSLQLSDSERLFIQKSLERHDAEAARREGLRKRLLQAAVAVALVLAVVAGIAVQQRHTAETLRLTETWKVLAFEAPRQMNEQHDDDLALLLSREAEQVRRQLPNQPAGLIDFSIYAVLPSNAFRHVLEGHDAAVMTVAFSPDGQTLASGSWDRTVRIWDLRQPQTPPRILATLDGGVWSVAFSFDGQRLAAGSDDGMVRLWDLNHPETAPLVLRGHRDHVQSVAFSPDGRLLASGSADGTVRLWNLVNPQAPVQVLSGDQGSIWSVAFDPGSARLIAGGDDGTVAVWDLSHTEKRELLLKAQSDAVRAVAWDSDGSTIAAGSADKTIALWNLQRANAPPVKLAAGNGAVWALAFSRDGKRLIAGGADATVRIWTVNDLQSGPLLLGPGHKGDIRSVTFSPDGTRIASGSEDTTVRIWDLLVSLPSTTILTGHTAAVNTVAFDATSQRLASASDDATIRIWNLRQPVRHRKCSQGIAGRSGRLPSVPTGGSWCRADRTRRSMSGT